ncbi:MAG TPA: potassium-transporting ATPase subunit KdpA [Acidimicrobiales bacterium]|nr:potassium-transporting ATPase subunit KdpA [Acidimicrobiales bacterium]
MTLSSVTLLAVFLAAVALCVKPLGLYMANVMEGRPIWPLRLGAPLERLIYRLSGVESSAEMSWKEYAVALLIFNALGALFLYALQRLQPWLPLNPQKFAGVSPDSSFNTAVSFVTNTNWQGYSGETTLSYLTQMLGLAVQNFLSAATGIVVAVVLIRGFARHSAQTIGNFWVDMTRATLYVLLPLAAVLALVLAGQGVVQTFGAYQDVTTVETLAYDQPKADAAGNPVRDAAGNPVVEHLSTHTQTLPMGPVASQESIKELGTNGGGFFNANSAHPFENPNAITNFFEIFLILLVPFAFPFMFGRMVGDRKQGYVVFAAMFLLWAVAALLAMNFEARGTPQLKAAGADVALTSTQGGGNMEGKETRIGSATCGLFVASTTSTSTGAIDCAHDSLTPLGGGVALVDIMLGEVSPGGTGSGLYGMLIFALLSVFIAGLMVGRTPEYLGKKIQAQEMKLVVLYILFVPMVILVFAGIAIVIQTATKSLLNPGPHGLTEMVYAYVSTANNNGSAFAGLNGNTNWFNTTFAVCMFVGRFFLMIPVLGIAGSLGRKQLTPATAGTFPTGSTLFMGLLVGVVIIVVGLTYFPVVALGPIVEHLVGHF